MTGKEIREEVDNYLIKIREERKNVGMAKVPEFDERDIKQAYRDGMQSGLWHHSYDYLVKTADLKKRYEKQKEINKELVDENEKLKKGASGATMLYKHLSRAKEIIKELVDFDFLPDIKIKKEAEEFLKDPEAEA
jgi:hypothetical protein